MDIFKTENLYFLGPVGTYAQSAMKKFCEDLKIEAKNIQPMNPITKIIQTVEANPLNMAVVPIENSIEGIVRETIDNLSKLKNSDIKIVAETVIPISHCLLSTSEKISDIKHIFSHPQALGQCSGYICQNIPDADVVETASTSEAAKIVKEKGVGYAAIASQITSEIYGLNILAEGINDEKDNKTRFLLLGQGFRNTDETCKTSIFFTVKNEPGSLVTVLNIFHKYNINLLYIESRPSKKKMGEYNFFVDLEGHIKDKNISTAISLAERITKSLFVLGSYPVFKI